MTKWYWVKNENILELTISRVTRLWEQLKIFRDNHMTEVDAEAIKNFFGRENHVSKTGVGASENLLEQKITWAKQLKIF
jgi:hypothetical protein